MEYRNPIYNVNGTIDCEISHPTRGWLPFTASPDDPEQYGRDLYAEIVASGQPVGQAAKMTTMDVRNEMEPVTQRQMRSALLAREVTGDMITEAIASIIDLTAKAAAEIEFNYSTQMSRSSPAVEQVLAILGFSPEQVDILWNEALAITS